MLTCDRDLAQDVVQDVLVRARRRAVREVAVGHATPEVAMAVPLIGRPDASPT